MSHYLVTGGAGFIGSNLVKKLIAQGHKVRVFDNYSGGKKPERLFPEVEYIEGDIRNLADLKKVMIGIDGVFHTAAIPRMPYSVEQPLETNEVNVTGTLQVLLAARDAGVKRVVYSASSSAYGDQPALPYQETMKTRPMSPYGLQKYIGEEYCRLFFELYGLQTVSLRYFNVYGPLMDPEGAYALVIGRFLKQKMAGEPMTVCGDGEYYRDYTHVTDVAEANILAMTTEGIGKGEVINIGNHDPHSVNELVKLIGGDFVNVPARAGDPRKTDADNTLAKNLLNWQPQIALAEGVEMLKKEWNIA
ncbi:MAG: Nucleoside-diphosphate-sugar epimerase [Candidatus Magasanikbacteria bacterium GW2011_GWC2_37_14]|uniref:Nucleoside-diphosphate-sugar epimerase n=1 Tax=Candidatus Magasanikbacteria bacterium GW2011_GWC2_37_14 TaxID=1619046 RepID=A0A0G0JIL6_9BACT|nr:MAG: Nucleoside-diphosphate-sugar epimerase [Candidatus Magasanikbacteria bacterium GW2011_GWC2_37_14]